MSPELHIAEQLSRFSDEDLFTLALRRRVALSGANVRHRRALVRVLAREISRGGNDRVLRRINHVELRVLGQLVYHPGERGLICTLTAIPPELSGDRKVLESLRLWGLLFPDDRWEHVELPPSTLELHPWLTAQPLSPSELVPPVLEQQPGSCAPRSGSLSRDVTELLARVDRGGWKQTQAQLPTRKDLKTLEPQLAIALPEYQDFLVILALALRLIVPRADGVLETTDAAAQWLEASGPDRLRSLARGWIHAIRFDEIFETVARPRSAPGGLRDTREVLLATVRGFPPGDPIGVESLHRAAKWSAPYSFPIGSQSATKAFGRLLRSLFWLGILELDRPDEPRAVRLSSPGAALLSPGAAGSTAPTPDETKFVLQANAEIFAPPNLVPQTYLHLRRITGEKKGAAAGMFPLTAASIRGALDVGLRAPDILRFLEEFSRTPLPATIRDVVETAARQHGRVQLVPANYVLVADAPELLRELTATRSINEFLGQSLSDRIAVVTAPRVELLKRALQARGYAPVDTSEAVVAKPLLSGSSIPRAGEAGAAAEVTGEKQIPASNRFPWEPPDLPGELPEGVHSIPGAVSGDPESIREILYTAWETGGRVEVQMRFSAWSQIVETRKLEVVGVDENKAALRYPANPYSFEVELEWIESARLLE